MLIHGCKSWLKIPCRFRGPHYTGQCTGYLLRDSFASLDPRLSTLCIPSHNVAERRDKEAKQRESGIQVVQSLANCSPPPPIPLLPSPGLPKKLTPIVKNSQGTPTLSKQPPVADLEGGLGAQLPLLWVKKRRKS